MHFSPLQLILILAVVIGPMPRPLPFTEMNRAPCWVWGTSQVGS